ncbi:hypothetical protein [Thalassomonas haliotis]|uniref:Uncharacterized protein n=1 Tax=Thalassomonas haliotis TaxID=485448 RepID=A0ABY7VE73_9GAMM|nr:hypothetical protein [Thalassomonas haliotis]WDE12019.1 hypothetical protein H3N35_00565 [Thalassomonas haliotis]
MDKFDNSEELIKVLVNMVTGKLHQGKTLERILSESGMAGVSIYSRVEIRARVLYQLGERGTSSEQLTAALAGFIAAYPVFRWSELRYRFTSNIEHEIEAVLHRLKYTSRYLEQEQEYVWAPKRMWTTRVKKSLQQRTQLGDPAYFDFLCNYPANLLLDNLRKQ